MTRRWIVWFIASTSFLRERLLWLSDVLCADAAPSILLVFLPKARSGVFDGIQNRRNAPLGHPLSPYTVELARQRRVETTPPLPFLVTAAAVSRIA